MSDPKYLQDGFAKQLSHAIEECGEFLAAAGKLQRWGPYSVNPELPREMQETNIDWLFREAMDVQDAIERMLESIRDGEHRRLDAESAGPGEFENFHRLLCERFGYSHDPRDWRRDQLSLIEHIASQVKPGVDHG